MSRVVHELVEDALRELADESYQRDLWLAAGGSEISSFGECIDRLWNDSGLTLALEGDGEVYTPEIDGRFRILDQLLQRVDDRRAPRAILEDPRLEEIRVLARELLLMLREYGADDELAQFDLGAAGAAYLHSAFVDGLTLAQHVLAHVDFAAGRVVTWAPPGTPHARLLDWETGGLMSASAGDAAAAHAVAAEFEEPGSILVAEDAMASCADLWVRENPWGLFCHGEEVYHYATPSGGVSQVEDALGRADAIYTLNAVVARTTQPAPGDRTQVDTAYLEALAREVVALLGRAYDGESYVLWRPSETTPAAHRHDGWHG